MILEACVGNLSDALSAQRSGAHQIELCDRLDLDGTSPSEKTVEEITAALDIPVKVIVNPKPFDYSYDSNELIEIENYINSLSKYNINGIVFGPINQIGMPDLDALRFISENTEMPITYHKAIDSSPNILKAMHQLIDQDIVSFILTSGGNSTAKNGADTIIKMDKILKLLKSKIQLIGAGKITDDNLAALHKTLNLKYYHGKLIVGQL